MPPNRSRVTRGNWRAVALSVLVHAVIVGAAVFGWFTWKHDTLPNTLAIEATVIDERALKGVEKAPEVPMEPPPPETPPPEPVPEPQPEPPPPEEQGPPKPDPAEVQRKEEERLAAEKLEQEKREQEDKAVQERLETEKKEAEKQAAAKAAAEKLAAAQKKADEKKRAEDARKAAEEKAQLARDAELRRSLEDEDRASRARSSEEANRWYAQIIARIERAWIKPPSAQAGIECIVSVTQVQGGEVTAVRVDSCTGGGEAMSQSVEAAVYRASPLPSPPNPALFERTLILTFKPG
jgi:colicin import membrane protein